MYILQCYFYKNELNKNSKTQTGFCCADGKIALPEIESPPSFICTLLKGSDNLARDFQINIRAYNSALSFTSMGCKIDERFSNKTHGIYTNLFVCCQSFNFRFQYLRILKLIQKI